MSCLQNAGGIYNLMISNTSFENVAKFKYLRMIQLKIAFMSKLKADEAWEILVTIQFRIFSLFISCLKI
jgi:hypothetical protein